MEELNKGYEFTKAQIAELESLRAWKAEIEAQEPVGEIVRTETSHGCDRTAISWLKYPYAKYGAKLYLSPVVSPDIAMLELCITRWKGLYERERDLYDKLSNENQSLKAELEAARSSRAKDALDAGWQPIETAPKDGNEYLFGAEDGSCGTGSWKARVNKFTALFADGIDIREWATHWKPLPAPPAIEQASSCNELHEKGGVK